MGLPVAVPLDEGCVTDVAIAGSVNLRIAVEDDSVSSLSVGVAVTPSALPAEEEKGRGALALRYSCGDGDWKPPVWHES
jgi:hypothetical protein